MFAKLKEQNLWPGNYLYYAVKSRSNKEHTRS